MKTVPQNFWVKRQKNGDSARQVCITVKGDKLEMRSEPIKTCRYSKGYLGISTLDDGFLAIPLTLNSIDNMGAGVEEVVWSLIVMMILGEGAMTEKGHSRFLSVPSLVANWSRTSLTKV